MVFCLCDSQLERWERDHSFVIHRWTLLRREGTIYFVQHNKNTSPASKWARFSCSHPIPFPQRKKSKTSKRSNQKEWENPKNRDYRLKDWVPLSYHLESPSLKDNQVSGRDVKTGICDITRILTVTHDRNIFNTKERYDYLKRIFHSNDK